MPLEEDGVVVVSLELLPEPLVPLPLVPEPPEVEPVSVEEAPLVPVVSCLRSFFVGCEPDIVPLLASLPAAGRELLSLWANATLAAPIMDTRIASRSFFMISPCKK
jgi:hypothetical protein